MFIILCVKKSYNYGTHSTHGTTGTHSRTVPCAPAEPLLGQA